MEFSISGTLHSCAIESSRKSANTTKGIAVDGEDTIAALARHHPSTMTIRTKQKFTPEVMLQAPRRSAATPSPDGKLAIFTQSTYSFETHTKSNEICVLDIANGQVVCVSKDNKASEPKWLGLDYDIVWLKEGENGNTSFIVSDASQPGKTYTAGTISGPLSSLKILQIEPGMVAVAVAGQANPDGSLYNPKNDSKPHSSARMYDSLFVRHWDRYVTPQRNTIFTALLQKGQPKVTSRQGRYHLMGFTNALQGSKLECPIPTFGGTDHFDVGREGLCLVAKDPELDPALHTKCNLYFVPKKDLMEMSAPDPVLIPIPGYDGAATSPCFSPDGRSIAFLKMKEDGYESDKNRLGTITGFASGVQNTTTVMHLDDHEHAWDRSPGAVMWSTDGTSLLLQAEDEGTNSLFQLSLIPRPQPGWHPTKLTGSVSGSIIDVVPAAARSPLLFVSSNSLVDNSIYTIIDPTSTESTSVPRLISSLSSDGSLFNLSPTQVTSFYYKGASSHTVHAWMVRPSFFHPSNKYPLAVLVHGGPQGAWLDSWSTRWNPAVFAEQGYVVICPNITGSTGYGQGFTDAIKEQWGGKPYEDLVKLFDYVEDELSYVDTDKVVGLGASYGGFMMNWIQGHDLAKRFKALVCHDGVFSMTGQLATDELYFEEHDMGGTLWENREGYERWDPSRFLKDGWKTPMLVVHSELDYRLTMAEGLSAFNVLQMKGVESRFLSFPDENHWVLGYENSLVWHLNVLNWINGFVGLPKLVDREGRDGGEYLVRGRKRRERVVDVLR